MNGNVRVLHAVQHRIMCLDRHRQWLAVGPGIEGRGLSALVHAAQLIPVVDTASSLQPLVWWQALPPISPVASARQGHT